MDSKMKHIANCLRCELQLGSEIENEDILNITKGSFVRARVELAITCDNLKKEMVELIKDSWLWL